MRKLLILLPFLVLPVSAWAQETPRFEIFGGYSNFYANVNNSSFDMNGVTVSAQENLNSWFGGVLDFSTHFGKENGLKTNAQTISYGPVFSYRKAKVIVPFAHTMVGVERGGTNYLNISQPEERLAVLAGGGLDVKVSPRIALRLIQFDYVYSGFSNTRQDNLRFSAGVVFLLGKKK
jgi:Outer membrane protein beta-barrel domain